MKAWIKKHWIDVLIITLIFCVFGAFCIRNIKAEIARKEGRKETSKLLKEIEEGIENNKQAVIKLLERCEPCLSGEKK